LFSNNKWQLDPMHYLDLILQRPQAFDSASDLAKILVYYRTRYLA